jgi:hypothetical protein
LRIPGFNRFNSHLREKRSVFGIQRIRYLDNILTFEQWKNLTEKGKKVKPYTEKGK